MLQPFVRGQGARACLWHDADLSRAKMEGRAWADLAPQIVAPLPERVWVTVDVDGLDPRLCPHTGTPVPGGLDLPELLHLLREIARSGRRIVGFDLCELAPGPDVREGGDSWDAIVGMRLLYHLSAWTLASQGRARLRHEAVRKNP